MTLGAHHPRNRTHAHRYNVVMVRLEHVLDSWRTIRQDTAAAVEDFPAGELDFRATPEVATFGEIARHILEASQGLTGLLLAGEENFATPDFRERLKPYMANLPADATAADLAAALRQSLDQRLAELAAKPADFFARIDHALRRPEAHPPGDGADHQGTRADPSGAIVLLPAVEGHRAGHHAAENGQTGR